MHLQVSINHRRLSSLYFGKVTLSPTNLALRHRLYPAERDVNAHRHDADDPKDLAVHLGLVTEDNGEDDAAQIASGASAARDDAVGVGVDVRN